MVKDADKTVTVQQLKDLVIAFRKERDWGKHHTPRNLAISISVEAAELLELFQWGEYSTRDKQKVTDELADVFIYCLNMADTMDINIATAVQAKLKKAAKKYPVELFNAARDSTDDYHRVKQAYRQKKQT